MSEPIFAINKLDSTLNFKSGYVSIPRLGFIEIMASDKDHPDFQYAFSRKWVEYSNTAPEKVELPKVAVIGNVEAIQGMTAEELKADLAKEKAPADIGKSEALGVSETTSGEAVVTQLGVDSQETEVAQEQKKGRGKKAAE